MSTSTILATVTAKVLTAAVVVASTTYVVAEVVATNVPVTPIEIGVEADAGSAVASSDADSIRSCDELSAASSTTSEGSSGLCITTDGLISDPGRALTTTGEALSESLRSSEAIATSIREGLKDAAAAPLSAGPNGSNTQS